MTGEPQLYLSANSFFGLGVETTRGTLASTIVWLPYQSPQQSPMQALIDDDAFRGSPVKTYDQVLGLRHDEMSFKGDAHLDTFPNLLRGGLGGTDAITGSGPYSHVIGLLNAATSGSQPPSYSLQDFNGFSCQQMLGCQLDSLDLEFTLTDSLKYTAKFLGLPFSTISTPSAETFSGVDKVIPAWSNAVTIAGSASATLVDGTLSIARGATPVAAAGSQGPVVNFAGPIAVTGKLTFLCVTSDPILNAGLTYDQQAIVFTFTDPSSSHTLAIQMSKVQFANPLYTRDKDYVQVTVDFTANANTTDATSGGYSPIKTTTSNSISTAY